MTLPQSTPEDAKRFFANKLGFTTGPMEVFEMLKQHEAINIVDVRAAKDYVKGHLPGAVSLPQEEWSLTNALDKSRLNIIYGYSTVCHLAAKAAMDFSNRGYRVMELDGGFKEWEAHKLPVETQSTEAEQAEGEPEQASELGGALAGESTQRTLH